MRKLQTILFWLAKNSGLFYLLTSLPVTPQIVPDGTLPVNTSVTTQENISNITGGTVAGGNLFHSFEQFSVPTGNTAYFNNSIDIQNIFSRVTGSSVSSINGLLRADGNANLFLLNPNGIIFGPNAQLNIGGSFLASTASSLKFADGKQFSATAPQTTPLLTISVPIGLGFRTKPGRILVQGDGQSIRRQTSDLIDTTAGLRVQPNQTLALVGGDVALEGGTLKTAGGRIELGSVTGAGLVNLTPTDTGWVFGYGGVPIFGEIQLSGAAAVDASGAGGGDIQVQGRQVALQGGSQIEASTLGSEPGGTLTVRASESVELSGTSADGRFPSGLSTSVYAGATGAGGNLILETGRLSVRNGAQILGTTSGKGSAGTLVVNALESVELSGTSADGRFPTGLFTSVQPGVTGAGGNLSLKTGRLSVSDGAMILGTTSGKGSAGTLVVNALESVELSGTSADGRFPSKISTSVYAGATGAGGNLILETGRLSVRDGAQILASTSGTGSAGTLAVNALESVELSGTRADGQFPTGLFTSVQRGATGAGGNLILETGRLSIRDGALISASTSGTGSAGTLAVNALESVELSGTTADGRFSSTLATRSRSTASGGDLRIETEQLTVRDRAEVTVSSEGSGSAGQLTVQARSIRLDNQGKLTAATFSGEGGNIALQVQDSVQMRRNSQISAEARGTRNGGNITIGTGTLAALENSVITANAFEGQGGNIQINTQGIFLSPDSEITASSQRGINGVVEINTADIDLQNSLTQLANNFVSPEKVVAGSCLARRNAEQGSFVVTGSGGLPINPYSGINEWESLTGVQPGEGEPLRSQQQPVQIQKTATVQTEWKMGDPVIEAQGIVKTAEGRTLLGMLPQESAPESPQSLVCHSS